MTRDYSHELNTEVRSISGFYELDEEGVIEIDGRQILYAMGNAAVDSACCGSYGCRFAVVPGFVVKWMCEKNSSGIPLSEVEPLRDQRVRTVVEEELKRGKGVVQVVFW